MLPNERMKGVKMSTSVRRDEVSFGKDTPAPNKYYIVGDFDFRDPNNLNDKVGKLPKFAFGIKPVIKSMTQDVPGPGTYEVDQYPMNQ